MKKILLISGGWDGHSPERIVQFVADELKGSDFEATIASSLDCLDDLEALRSYDVIFPCWTMGALSDIQSRNLVEAVRGGVGLAGIHGGMGDAFRGNLDYEWMVGGHFVSHPYVGDYTVRFQDRAHPITKDLPEEFSYTSEQYYLLVDPGVHVLADTEYTYEGRTVTMPVAWVKPWGKGRVFYSALGHAPEEFTAFPVSLQLVLRGVLWAANVR
jgi:type 1 glutamine amidotransferase